MSDPYIIHGIELSYFTRKLEAACLFYGLDFEMRRRTPQESSDVESRSGTHQVPVLQTPENWMIGDTTPVLQLLDARFPRRRMFPEGPIGVLVHAVEEYFDEWIPRVMVHYRWHYPDSALFASMRVANGLAEAAEQVRNWGARACTATGTASETQQQAAEDEYLRVLEAAETQLEKTRYLLGDRPSAVDCVVLGGLRAHTCMDPDPKKVTAGYPRVVAFSEGFADGWDGSGELAPFPASTEFARFVLGEMANTYQPFVLANRAAQRGGATACQAHIHGEEVSFLSRPYPEQSRQMVVDRIRHALSDADRQRVIDWLAEVGLHCFTPGA